MLGASKDRQQTRPPADSSDLADIELVDLEGNPTRLGDVWSENPAVVVFLRHYG
jgi:prostamide/prostaglandin F2alpha synthase